MKYTNTLVSFREFPDEISLCINISDCKFKCPDCHSKELWEDIGTTLNQNKLGKLIENNKGITCIGFMGGKPKVINKLATFIKHSFRGLKVGWYWGGTDIPSTINLTHFDYIKIGPFIKEYGPLTELTTNQKMFQIVESKLIDITYKFHKNG